jgi:hypothetical protein
VAAIPPERADHDPTRTAERNRPMPRSWICRTLAAALLAIAPVAQTPAEYAAAHEAKLGALRRAAEQQVRELEDAWKYLRGSERRELTEYFTAQTRALESRQRALVARAGKLADRDSSLWPVERELAYYDPQTHAPRQPIKRKRLAPDDQRVISAQNELAPPLPGALHAAWRYDWGARGLVRSAAPALTEDDAERVFANACLGLPPDADLAIALVERALDDGAQAAAQAAFAHAYTDRDGGVYPFTLYAAWGSGRDIEMPDVDTLGLYHELFGDSKRFVAPVPNKLHKELYDATLFPRFAAARVHRAPREGLAQTWLRAEPTLSQGYDAAVIRFHALWHYMNEQPPALGKTLSENTDWDRYFTAWTASLAKNQVLYERGHERQLALYADEQALRGLMSSCMRELGLLGRTALPEAESKPGG